MSTGSGCGARPCIATCVSSTRHHGDKVYQRVQVAPKSTCLIWYKEVKQIFVPCALGKAFIELPFHRAELQTCFRQVLLDLDAARVQTSETSESFLVKPSDISNTREQRPA